MPARPPECDECGPYGFRVSSPGPTRTRSHRPRRYEARANGPLNPRARPGVNAGRDRTPNGRFGRRYRHGQRVPVRNHSVGFRQRKQPRPAQRENVGTFLQSGAGATPAITRG
jgi:hypothetical protein